MWQSKVSPRRSSLMLHVPPVAPLGQGVEANFTAPVPHTFGGAVVHSSGTVYVAEQGIDTPLFTHVACPTQSRRRIAALPSRQGALKICGVNANGCEVIVVSAAMLQILGRQCCQCGSGRYLPRGVSIIVD